MNNNTGDSNTGDRNTGDWNTGDWNTGDWNTGNRNTGYFNTDIPRTIRVFGKEIDREEWNKVHKPSWLYFSLTEWIPKENMTDEEKFYNPEHETINGYLKKYYYKEAFQKSYNKATKEEQLKIKDLPNFDADMFFEISGIRVDEDKKEMTMEELEKELGRKIKIVK